MVYDSVLEPWEVGSRKLAEKARASERLISVSRVTVMLDPMQYLLARYTLAYTLRPLLATKASLLQALLSKNPVRSEIISTLRTQLSLISDEAVAVLDQSCRKAYSKPCEALSAVELIDLPLHMQKAGVPINIVVEVMTYIYASLLYLLRLVGPEALLVSMPEEEELVPGGAGP